MDVIKQNLWKMVAFYHWSQSVGDERVKDWPLMQSPWPTLSLCGLYLVIVAIGPRIMKNCKKFQLKPLLIVYNFGVLLLNLYIVVQLAWSSAALGYSWFCQPVEYTKGFHQMNIAAALWWYYISKVIEFSDTFFFILRKKNEQLSFLHVYHHSTMFFLWWIGVKYVAGGSSFLAAMTNSFVHIIMYGYYGLSALGPKIQKYLWWKKYITCIQLIQFGSAAVLGIRALIVGCDFPMWMQYALVIYMSSFVILFSKFYKKAYKKLPKTKKRK